MSSKPSAPQLILPEPGEDPSSNEQQENQPEKMEMDPADILLPNEKGEFAEQADRLYPDLHGKEHIETMRELLKRQERQMGELLEQMKRIDVRSNSVLHMIVYNKAYKATKEGLEAIGDVTDPPAPEKVDLTPEERELKEKKIRNWAKICIDEGKWMREAADEFLQKRFGRCLDVTLPELRYAGMRRLTDPPQAASPEMRGAADPLDMKAEAVRGFSCTNDL